MSDPAASLRRFSTAERWVHRIVAILMLSCVLTALSLYNGPLASIVQHRRVVKLIHVWSGFALPVPLVIALSSAAYRADLRRLNRFSAADRKWLRPGRTGRSRLPVGKFNAGQKLNAALSAGAIMVLLGTGILMNFTGLARLDWRTGATFVHDWTALCIGLLVAGHVYRALQDPGAREGLRTGRVSREWAGRHHAAWLAEVDAEPQPDGEARSGP